MDISICKHIKNFNIIPIQLRAILMVIGIIFGFFIFIFFLLLIMYSMGLLGFKIISWNICTSIPGELVRCIILTICFGSFFIILLIIIGIIVTGIVLGLIILYKYSIRMCINIEQYEIEVSEETNSENSLSMESLIIYEKSFG